MVWVVVGLRLGWFDLRLDGVGWFGWFLVG